jgi:hypothetical protein
MQLRAAFQIGTGSAFLLIAAVAVATPPVGPAPAPQSPEVMLYMSWPMGGGSRSAFKLPNLSVRLGQARLGGNSGNPSAGDPMQHRELFRMEVFGRQDQPSLGMRLELGGRVSYDLHRGVFGLRTDGWRRPSAVQGVTSNHDPLGLIQKPLRPSVWEVGARQHDGASGTRQPAMGARSPAGARSLAAAARAAAMP